MSNLPELSGRINIPSVFSPFHQIISAESLRIQGLSSNPYSSLNLGLNTNDDKRLIKKNRELFFHELSIDPSQVAYSFQIHKDKIIQIKSPGQYHGFDALITNLQNLFLTVTIADCASILVYDSKNQAVAAIHAGWRGTFSRIVEKTLDSMNICFGTSGKDCYAYISTCISRHSFEVDEDVAVQFSEKYKQWNDRKKKFLIDLKLANYDQLIEMGLQDHRIEISPYCTVLHNNYFFSHRKEKGRTGRMLCLIGMKGQ